MFSLFSLVSISLIFLFGFLGGLGLSLLHERGLEIPHWKIAVDRQDREKNKKVWFFDMGFLGEALIGGFAALISFGLSQPTEEWQVISSSLIAGLGGAGILKGFVEKGKSQELEQIANEAVNQTSVALANQENAKPKASSRRPAGGLRKVNLAEFQNLKNLEHRLAKF